MGFTKLDERILQSSIMAENPATFKVWITLLASCGANGIAYVSAVYLSTICHLPLLRVQASLDRLESPDEHSRSLADDGRRIRRVDGGYAVINYDKYREFTYSPNPEAVRKREYRSKVKGGTCPGHPGTSPGHSASASSSASDLNKGAFDSWWARYPRKIAKQDAAKAYQAALKAATPEDLEKALSGYIIDLKKNNTEEKFIKHPATFLRADRWRDYLEGPSHPPVQVGENTHQDHGPTYWSEVRRLHEAGVKGEEFDRAIADFLRKAG